MNLRKKGGPMENVVRDPGPQELITDWYIPEADPAAGWVYPGPRQIGSDPMLVYIANALSEACTERDSEEFVVREDDRIYRGQIGRASCRERVSSPV